MIEAKKVAERVAERYRLAAAVVSERRDLARIVAEEIEAAENAKPMSPGVVIADKIIRVNDWDVVMGFAQDDIAPVIVRKCDSGDTAERMARIFRMYLAPAIDAEFIAAAKRDRQRIAAAVKEDREACAAICEDWKLYGIFGDREDVRSTVLKQAASLIRSRD